MHIWTKRLRSSRSGMGLFADALAAQAAEATPVLWRPPLPGTDEALATVTADPRMPDANAEAARRLTTARPRLVGIVRAGDALGLERGEFLHAGPPIAWADACGPMRGALLGALVYEGMADSVEAAEALAPTVQPGPGPFAARGRTDGRADQPVDAGLRDARRGLRHDRLLHAQRGPGQGAALRRVQPGRDRPAAVARADSRSGARSNAATGTDPWTCRRSSRRRCRWATRVTTATEPEPHCSSARSSPI